MRAEAGVGSVRKGRGSRARRDRVAMVRRRWKTIAAFVGVLLLAALVVGFAYSGSPDVVAEGVTVSGEDVGGLPPAEAQARLDARARALANEPVVFTGAGRRRSIAPARAPRARPARAARGGGGGPPPPRGGALRPRRRDRAVPRAQAPEASPF